MKTLMSLCAAAALGLLLFAGLGCEYNHYDDDHHGGHGYRERVYYNDDVGYRGGHRHHRHHDRWRHDGYQHYDRN